MFYFIIASYNSKIYFTYILNINYSFIQYVLLFYLCTDVTQTSTLLLNLFNNICFCIFSDFPNLASDIPYFQCDSDLRAFSLEGMHLVVCVHGLNGKWKLFSLYISNMLVMEAK